jgi:4-amino-4-deoxychorismate lyase
MMLVNGRRQCFLDAADRAVSYGDGLFETIAVVRSRPALWEAHLARLRLGCQRLGLPTPELDLLDSDARALLDGVDAGVLKIVYTAGSSGRGFRRGACSPTRILSVSPLPEYPRAWWQEGVDVRWCALRLAQQPRLAGLKHLNRLEQVLARAEWSDPRVAEGVLLDQNECVIEGTMTNLFVLVGEQLFTPMLDEAGVRGVMRGRVLELAAELGIPCSEVRLSRAQMLEADEVFLTNSVIGVWPVCRLEGHSVPQRTLARRLQARLQADEHVAVWV